ncbi:amino acid ABC transporter permease [Vibrio tritonius]|uniref:Amino acid ABC transporter permease n=1 Tax=Vibrio tritonius TaxID=1435069 RepID=A0ABS7YN40_9VIBR|nr:amino acid ABC transporter permease [Vibrio tritonius]MCA2017086.1 amino acid ABC transporter permease [Vibrio tritonius]
MNEWAMIWEARDWFIDGFTETLYLFAIAAVIGFIFGLVLLYILEAEIPFLSRAVRVFMTVMRTVPFLILAYLLYYGLGQYGFRMEAEVAGLVSLILYHGAYFCEILRGQRLVMQKGLIEAAHAHGFRHHQTFLYVILPNVVLSALPLLGNQLIITLKDTAFLCIITVQEITASANSVQSTYFIPFKAFLVAIALYWIVGLAIENSIKLIGLIGKKKGFYHA